MCMYFRKSFKNVILKIFVDKTEKWEMSGSILECIYQLMVDYS